MRRRPSGLPAAILAAAALAALAAPAPALAGDPIMPLDQVEPGMVGEARTVVQGTEIVTFPVRIIDVRVSGDAPGGALIYARAEGPLMEQTGGVAQGMSGSPVYITGADGVPRVIGALAYGTGDQEGVIAGITPIEQMLRSASGARLLERGGPRRRIVHVAGRRDAVAAQRRDPDVIALHPLMRWSVAGASPGQIPALRRGLGARGITLDALGPRTVRKPQPLVPGASMSALVSAGDLALGAVGTVTYVDGNKVLGFGHTFLGSGRARYLMGDAYVIQTIAAPIAGASYKLADPGVLQGAIVGDRTDGVIGVVGAAGGIPAISRAVDRTRRTSSTVRATLAPDERVLPLTAALLQSEPALRVRDGLGGGTIRLTFRIASRSLPRPIVYRNMYAAYGDVVSVASPVLATAVSMLTQNNLSAIPISRIEVSQTLERRVRQAVIIDASVTPAVLRPGGRATLNLRVLPWRSGVITVRVPFRVPAGLRPGERTLRVVPNTGEGFDAAPPDLSADLGLAAGLGGTASQRRAIAAMQRRAARRPGVRTARVAEAATAILGGRNDAVRLAFAGRPQVPARVLPVGYVVTGGRATVRVRVGR